jgi:hypothetical protein
MTPKAKKKYTIHNWKEYNKALIQRGSITFWFSQDAIDKWHSLETSGKRGRPQIYSNDAILSALLVRAVYKLPLRALVGFLMSIATLMGLALKIPCYSQISRRAKSLQKALKKLSNQRPCHIVFDSTGLKVYGEGEWKVRKHGWSKRRTWRKLHIGMDPDSKEIIVSELTRNGSGSRDSEIGKKLMDQVPRSIKKVLGDGAYDDISFRRSAKNNGADLIVPPPRNAALHDSDDPAVIERNDAIKQIIGLGDDEEARALWKILTGYHERSLGETTMYRIKQLTGSSLQSRREETQSTEAYVKCLVINKMTMMGMPKSSWI